MRRKKDKKDHRKSDSQTDTIKEITHGMQKLEIISYIEELERKAQNHKINEEFDKAIIIADKIMRIAFKYELEHYIKEEEKFINSIARKVQKNQITAQIEEFGSWIIKQYDKLVNADGIFQAHDLVQTFKKIYSDLPFFESIPVVQEILNKDKREWIKYNASH